MKARLNRYCRAAKALGLPNLMRLDNCAGLQEALDTCLHEGKCDDCHHYVGTTPGEIDYNFVVPVSAPVTSSTTVEEVVEVSAEPEVAPLPLCPDGLMPWEGNPDCCVPNPRFIGDGACDPDAPYNTEVCGYDGGDCCHGTCNANSAFRCTTTVGSDLEEYGPFGFYCKDPSQGSAVISNYCDIEEKYRIGDGQCNPMLNIPECNYDGGDCCEESCSDTYSFYPCGSGIQSYVCLDPEFMKVDTKAPHPTRAPTQAPQHVQQDTLLGGEDDMMAMACPMDMLECPGGQYMNRNPNNGCAFDPCPESPQEETVRVCDSTLKECPTGEFVSQDPANFCRFYPCPEVEEEDIQEQSSSTTVDKQHSLASSIASAMHSKNNYMQEADEPIAAPKPEAMASSTLKCDDDVLECSGGAFVARDPSNNCKFFPCPPIKEDETTSSLADAISSSLGTQNTPTEMNESLNSLANSISSSFTEQIVSKKEQVQCTDQVKRCPDGSFVRQNPNDQCEYFPCSSSITPMTEEHTGMISMAGMIHSKYNAVVECSSELKKCADGVYVGQDPDNSCKFYPCKLHAAPATNVLEQMSEEWHCATDVYTCADGTFVGRDVDNDCKFFECPNSEEEDVDMNQMYEVMETHSGPVPSHHKKKNRSK